MYVLIGNNETKGFALIARGTAAIHHHQHRRLDQHRGLPRLQSHLHLPKLSDSQDQSG